jgi:hypothetical protein
MNYYSVLRRNELSIHSKTQWTPKCERSQLEKPTHYMIPAIQYCGKGKSMNSKKDQWLSGTIWVGEVEIDE